MSIELLHIDCMEYMATQEDNAFDLAIVDPPYGIGENWKKDKHSLFYKHESGYKNDVIPGPEYFAELFRVSKNQIIWGGNYFTDHLPARNGWIVWDKKRDQPTQHMAEGELAWHSLKIPLRIVELVWNGACLCENKYGKHPHEKPIKLYQWVLHNYASPGQRILDTHLGSGSSAIAAYYGGYDFVGCELEQTYLKDTLERYHQHTKQMDLLGAATA